MAGPQLTPLQLNAAAGLLQNQGIGINANLISAINSYESTSLMTPFLAVATSGNISANASVAVETLAANTCAAFSNSVPPDYNSIGTQMTVAVLAQATVDICGNNVAQLTQAVNQAQGYASQTTTYVNAAVNSQSYLGNTFTNMNDTITGGIDSVSNNTVAFGADLVRLGRLINLADLFDFGSPLALTRQLFAVGGVNPTLTAAFVQAGISQEIVINITNPSVSLVDSTQRAMYRAMTQIKDNDLAQILQVLQVTTPGIETMADLLNPIKIFPNSYLSLLAPTPNGSKPIYLDSDGAVNSELSTLLPPYVVSSLI